MKEEYTHEQYLRDLDDPQIKLEIAKYRGIGNFGNWLYNLLFR